MASKKHLVESIKSTLDIIDRLVEDYEEDLSLSVAQNIQRAKKQLYNGLHGKSCGCPGEKRKPSNYNNYIRWKTERLREDKTVPSKDRFWLASQGWSKLSQKEKEKFNDLKGDVEVNEDHIRNQNDNQVQNTSKSKSNKNQPNQSNDTKKRKRSSVADPVNVVNVTNGTNGTNKTNETNETNDSEKTSKRKLQTDDACIQNLTIDEKVENVSQEEDIT